MEQTNKTTAPEVIITRTLNAPRDLVYETFTECKHLMNWWGPKGFTMTHCDIDLRPGGHYHYCLEGPDGSAMWGKAIYQEIERPETLIYTVSFSDKDGGITTHPMAPDWPREMLTVNTFTEHDGKTTLTMRAAPHNATEVELQAFLAGQDGMDAGTNAMLNALEEYLKDV